VAHSAERISYGLDWGYEEGNWLLHPRASSARIPGWEETVGAGASKRYRKEEGAMNTKPVP
jgi:hypothetical protein